MGDSQNNTNNNNRRPGGGGDSPKKYTDVITDKAESDEGLFDVHKIDDKYYFEVDEEMLDREMLLVTRVAGTTQNLSFGGAGQKARNQQVVRWMRKDDKILLRHVSYSSVANEDDPIYESVRNNNFEPVIFSFDVEVEPTDSTGLVFDVTRLYTTDVALLSGLSSFQRRNFQVRRLDGARSFVQRMASY
ncbi:MAG: DUF5117 domain-containing protein, partial [Balneolales bacterium]|nr:DUF5117 domain-containing protein [Balneolales bacterium]